MIEKNLVENLRVAKSQPENLPSHTKIIEKGLAIDTPFYIIAPKSWMASSECLGRNT